MIHSLHYRGSIGEFFLNMVYEGWLGGVSSSDGGISVGNGLQFH